MAKRKSYEARFERDEDNYWSVVVEVDSKRSAISDGQTLPKARKRIRQSLAALLDVDEDSFDILEMVAHPANVQHAIDEYAAARKALDSMATALEAAQRRAAAALVKNGLSLRDAGDVLGITGQRVQQVIAK